MVLTYSFINHHRDVRAIKGSYAAIKKGEYSNNSCGTSA
jgi:hypothetical protein